MFLKICFLFLLFYSFGFCTESLDFRFVKEEKNGSVGHDGEGFYR